MALQLSGVWLSTYRYHDGKSESSHFVKFEQIGNTLFGEGVSSGDDSKLTLNLKLDDAVGTGIWQEKTDPNGLYKGQLFRGGLQVIVDQNQTKMTGKWIGHNSTRTTVNNGVWELVRQS